MPSGRYVTAEVLCYDDECVMTVVVHALSEDRYVSQGLCGDYDGFAGDDLTQAGLPIPSYPEEPIEFSKHFM